MNDYDAIVEHLKKLDRDFYGRCLYDFEPEGLS